MYINDKLVELIDCARKIQGLGKKNNKREYESEARGKFIWIKKGWKEWKGEERTHWEKHKEIVEKDSEEANEEKRDQTMLC